MYVANSHVTSVAKKETVARSRLKSFTLGNIDINPEINSGKEVSIERKGWEVVLTIRQFFSISSISLFLKELFYRGEGSARTQPSYNKRIT